MPTAQGATREEGSALDSELSLLKRSGVIVCICVCNPHTYAHTQNIADQSFSKVPSVGSIEAKQAGRWRVMQWTIL